MSLTDRLNTRPRKSHPPVAPEDGPLFDDPKRQAYSDIRRGGKDRERMNSIMELLGKNGPMTAQEIADDLDVPPNYVTGPINQLVHKFYLVERMSEKKLNQKTGKVNSLYRRISN